MRSARVTLGAVAVLIAASCGGKVIVDGVQKSGEACAAACEEQNPDGLHLYNNLKGTCVCRGCSQACTQSVCNDKQTPSDACLPCVQESLRGDACNVHAGLFGSCLGHKECAELVACIEACGQ